MHDIYIIHLRGAKTSEGKTTKRLDLALARRFCLGEGVGSLERRFCLGEGVGSLERRFSFARLPGACFDSAWPEMTKSTSFDDAPIFVYPGS